ncbi:MAG: bifunctional hydroxymethylpyrimidine kinase/phosphomethylpyrimidine kinase [Microbacterium sp.]
MSDAWAEGRDRWELDRRPADVLLIGSQVAFGSVGMNGVLPRLDDARAMPLPTVVLSNLPHYPSVHAAPMPADWLREAIGDLDALGVLDEIDTVCTGYFAAPEQVEAVADALEPLLMRRPGLRVLVDPTLGDADVGLYTDPAVAPALRSRLLPLATGIVPNRFELALLSEADAGVSARSETGAGVGRERDSDAAPSTSRGEGRFARTHATDTPAGSAQVRGSGTTEADLAAAARALLGPRAEWAVVSGGAASGGDTLVDLIVTRDGVWRREHPLIPTTVKGTGDAFCGALLSALRGGRAVADAVDAASAVVRALLT